MTADISLYIQRSFTFQNYSTFVHEDNITPMKYILLVGMGGFIGSIIRYGIGLLSLDSSTIRIGMGTLVSNVLGCFIFGLVYYIGMRSSYISEDSRKFLLIGLCGGLTTFSSFIFDLQRYLEAHSYDRGALYLFLNIGLGLLAFYFASWLTKTIAPI